MCAFFPRELDTLSHSQHELQLNLFGTLFEGLSWGTPQNGFPFGFPLKPPKQRGPGCPPTKDELPMSLLIWCRDTVCLRCVAEMEKRLRKMKEEGKMDKAGRAKGAAGLSLKTWVGVW